MMVNQHERPQPSTPADLPAQRFVASWLRLPQWSAVPLLLAVGSLLFGLHVGQRGLWSAHEGRAAQNAQTMLDTGQWLRPTLFIDEWDTQKPPLYYWMVAGISALKDGQVTAQTVRAPAVIAALAGLLLVYSMAKSAWGWQTGLLAGLILATTTRYAWLSRVGRIDLPLTVLCLAALAVYWRDVGRLSAKPGKLGWSFYVCLGLGLLLKGPIAIVLVMLPIVAFSFFESSGLVPWLQRDWRAIWQRWRLGRGSLLLAAVGAPWFVYAVWVSHGQFFNEFFLYHNFDRAMGTSEGLKSGPFWYYLPHLFIDSFPWSILFPALGLELWQHRSRLADRHDNASRIYVFLLCWVAAQFLLFSLVRFKRPDYLSPVTPAVALLLAGWLRDRMERFEFRLANRPARNPKRRLQVLFLSAGILAVLVAVLLAWVTQKFVKRGIVHTIFEIQVFERYLNSTDRFMLEHVEQILRENRPILVIGMFVVAGCVWLLHTGWHARKNAFIAASMALPWSVAFLFQIHLLLPALDPLRDMAAFAEVVRTVATREQTIYYFDKFDADLVFHIGKPARMVMGVEELAQLSDTTEPRFVVAKASVWDSLQDDPRLHWWAIADNRRTAFGEHRDPRVLLVNRPATLADRPTRDPAALDGSF